MFEAESETFIGPARMARWAVLCFLDSRGRLCVEVKTPPFTPRTKTCAWGPRLPPARARCESAGAEAVEEVAEWNKTIAQRLKPNSIWGIYGTTEVVP